MGLESFNWSTALASEPAACRVSDRPAPGDAERTLMRSQWAGVCFGIATVAAVVGCAHRGPLREPHNLPPAAMLNHPGPGVAGPGPGVMMPPGGEPLINPAMAGVAAPTSQLAFIDPDGAAVQWDVSGMGLFDSQPLIVPARQNFAQAAIYRLKLTSIPGRPGVELYPTLEVGPATPRTDAYLAHNAIPIQFTEEDLDQVLSGNFVTKVIYLPDPEFQELALAGVETLVSTRLDPGVDPIVEADRRGAIMAVVRLGNKDLEVPGVEGGFIGEQVIPVAHQQPGAQQASYPHGATHGGFDPNCQMPLGTSYAAGPGGPMPMGVSPAAMARPALPPHLSGVTIPQWGMPITGTPIGLPGPPHIPLGVPAGLQQHVVKNHTHVHMPGPVKKFKIDVKQTPGYSYPKPVNQVSIHETTMAPYGRFRIPHGNKNEVVLPQNHDCQGANCPVCR